MDESEIASSQQVDFIDYHAINWHDVRRIRCQFYQRFYYEYPGPIRDLKQRLVIVPAEKYGSQQLRDHTLVINPSPMSVKQTTDSFGNRVVELEVPEADGIVSFETLMIVESEAYDRQRPVISASQMYYFLEHTRLTLPNRQIRDIALQLKADADTAYDLAISINDWVYGIMRYASGVTSVETTAAEVLALGQGLCQDYSHLMLSLCRSAGLSARYVSGHLLGEGGSHAWVEVFLRTERGLSAFAFDPTNHRQVHLGYITVAVGRDYRDVSPTSGSYTAPYSGQLTCHKRAGLTFVEYLNGHTLQSKKTL